MAFILIIDDSEFVLEIAAEELENAGHSIETASNVFAAMRLLQKLPIDLVLLDINMPGVGGLHLLEHFKDSVLLRLTRVVLFSEEAPERLTELAQYHNIAGYVTKQDVYDGLLAEKIAVVLAQRDSLVDFSPEDQAFFERIALFDTLVHQDHGAARELLNEVKTWETSESNRIRVTRYMEQRLARAPTPKLESD